MRETIRSSRVWLGLLVVVAFGALAVGGASGFDSGAHVKRFTSHRYGYSLVVPRGWFAYPATTSVPANSSELPSVVDSSVDHFSGSDGGQIGVSATKMTPGLTLKSWAAGTPKRLQILFGCKPTAAVAGQVAGVAAAVFTIRPSCGGPLRLASTDYAVARGGYGYDIRVVSSASSQAHDHAVFEQTLTTFRFTR